MKGFIDLEHSLRQTIHRPHDVVNGKKTCRALSQRHPQYAVGLISTRAQPLAVIWCSAAVRQGPTRESPPSEYSACGGRIARRAGPGRVALALSCQVPRSRRPRGHRTTCTAAASSRTEPSLVQPRRVSQSRNCPSWRAATFPHHALDAPTSCCG